MPALFLSGDRDEIVPPSQFLQLFKLCSCQKKRLRQFPNGTHNDTCVQPSYWTEVQKWLQEEISQVPKDGKPRRGETYDEKRMEGAEQELVGSIGAGSIAP